MIQLFTMKRHGESSGYPIPDENGQSEAFESDDALMFPEVAGRHDFERHYRYEGRPTIQSTDDWIRDQREKEIEAFESTEDYMRRQREQGSDTADVSSHS